MRDAHGANHTVPATRATTGLIRSCGRAALAAAVMGLVSAVVHAQGLPTSYDLRSVTVSGSTQSWISSIQDQGMFGDCWTFASAAAMDSSLLKQGILAAASTPPSPVVASWALSTANGAPESLIGPDYGHSNSDWGGFEFQTMAYVTRGQGTWPIPGTVDVPMGYCGFPKEILRPPRSVAARVYRDIRRWTAMPRGGHFAAMEQPDALAAEIREFFRPLREAQA